MRRLARSAGRHDAGLVAFEWGAPAWRPDGWPPATLGNVPDEWKYALLVVEP